MKTLTEWMGQLDEKRAIAIGAAGALVALSLDAAAGHFAGRAGVHPAQWLPVILGPTASALVLGFAVPKLDGARFRRAMLVIGGTVAALGASGTAFHLRSLLTLLRTEPLGMQALETALAEGPPMFAPGGFFGLGALLAALGSTKLVVRFGLRGAAVAEVDGDGHLDLLCGNQNAQTLRLFWGDGTRPLEAVDVLCPPQASGGVDFAIGDLDRDGAPDFVTNSQPGDATSVFFHNGGRSL